MQKKIRFSLCILLTYSYLCRMKPKYEVKQ